MKILPAEQAFLGTEQQPYPTYEQAKAVVIPFGLEASVSYGGGTSRGPQAMIDASPQLEMFDEQLWCEPYKEIGIVTLADDYLSHWERSAKAKPETGEGKDGAVCSALYAGEEDEKHKAQSTKHTTSHPHPKSATPISTSPSGRGIPAALAHLESLVQQVLEDGKFPMTFGGEHAITAGTIRPFAEKYDNLAILHFDAHADLRDGYDGEHYSHAAALRRCLDDDAVAHRGAHIELVSCGIRNISASEIPFYEANKDRIHIYWGKDIKRWNVQEIVSHLKGRPVYLTFDVDGFDGSLMPATGTPEPGGLFWNDAIEIITEATKVSTIVGADVNELAPIDGWHACDFLAAKLAYKIMALAMCKNHLK